MYTNVLGFKRKEVKGTIKTASEKCARAQIRVLGNEKRERIVIRTTQCTKTTSKKFRCCTMSTHPICGIETLLRPNLELRIS